MVHELIGIRNGRVDLSGVPDIKPELKVIDERYPARNIHYQEENRFCWRGS